MVALAPEIIMATGSPRWPCERRPVRTIVFALVADPVGAGFVENLARPGSNATDLPDLSIPSARNGWSC